MTLYIGRMAFFSMQIKICFSRQDERPIEISAWLVYLISKRFLKVREINAFLFFSEVFICLYSEFSGNQHPSPCSALFNTALILKTILFVLCIIIHCKQENHFCVEQMSFFAAKVASFHTIAQSAEVSPPGALLGNSATGQISGWTSAGSAGDTMLKSFEAWPFHLDMQ